MEMFGLTIEKDIKPVNRVTDITNRMNNLRQKDRSWRGFQAIPVGKADVLVNYLVAHLV